MECIVQSTFIIIHLAYQLNITMNLLKKLIDCTYCFVLSIGASLTSLIGHVAPHLQFKKGWGVSIRVDVRDLFIFFPGLKITLLLIEYQIIV